MYPNSSPVPPPARQPRSTPLAAAAVSPALSTAIACVRAPLHRCTPLPRPDRHPPPPGPWLGSSVSILPQQPWNPNLVGKLVGVEEEGDLGERKISGCEESPPSDLAFPY